MGLLVKLLVSLFKPLVLEPDDPLLASLPKVTASPGSTPEAVHASVTWDVNAMQAVVSWTASSDPHVTAYKIRMSLGLTYDSDTATVIGNVPAGILEHRTTQGLVSPGDTVSYKVFVVLTTGNESGSNTVIITRP